MLLSPVDVAVVDDVLPVVVQCLRSPSLPATTTVPTRSLASSSSSQGEGMAHTCTGLCMQIPSRPLFAFLLYPLSLPLFRPPVMHFYK